MPIYLMLFNEEGRLVDYQVITPDLAEESIASYRERGYIEGNINEFFVYANPTSGEYSAGYIRDSQTGSPISAMPYEASKEMIIEMLYNKVISDLNIIESAMKEALIDNDAEFVNLWNKRETLLNDYKEALEELAEEGDEGNGESNNGGENEGETGTSDNDNSESENIVADAID